MNKIFTSDSTLAEHLSASVSDCDSISGPSSKTLEFIRNFAHNFRINRAIDGRAQELILN